MKMAKKFLAIALAGVLALSVLTGCGDSANTKSIAEAMSDMKKVEEITVKEDTELNAKAKKIVEALAKADAKPDAKPEAKPQALAGDEAAEPDKGLTNPQKAKIMEIMGDSYNKKFVWVSVTETKGYNTTAQASNLLHNMTEVNLPKGVDKDNYAKTWYIGTTTVTKDGKTCRFAVITAEAQTSAGGESTEQGSNEQGDKE